MAQARSHTENQLTAISVHTSSPGGVAVILRLAARPDLAPIQKRSRGIAALRQVSWGEWSNFVANRYSEPLVKDKKFLSEWVHQGGLRVRKDAVGPTIPVFGDQGRFHRMPAARPRNVLFHDSADRGNGNRQ